MMFIRRKWTMARKHVSGVAQTIRIAKRMTPAPISSIQKDAATDGLRAIACLIVLFFHAVAGNLPEMFWLLKGTARIGVWLFFVLSAFLLTTRLLANPLSVSSLIKYTVDRFIRIVPLFVLAAFLYFLFGMIGITTVENFWLTITMQRSAGHLWTIPPEMGFYVVLPVLVFVLELIRRSLGAKLSVILLILSLAAWLFVWPTHGRGDDYTLPYLIVCFGLGTLAAYAHKFLPRIEDNTAVNLVTAAILGMVAYSAFLKSPLYGDPTNSLIDKQVEFAAFWAVITFAMYSRSHAWSRALSFKPLSALGQAIYSTYLFHWFFMEWFAVNGAWWGIPLSIILSLITGWMGYKLLENPLNSVRYWLSDKLVRSLGQMPVDDNLSSSRGKPQNVRAASN